MSDETIRPRSAGDAAQQSADDAGEATPAESKGPDMAKWIVRIQLLAILAAAVVAVLGSLDDIKRYYHISRMS